MLRSLGPPHTRLQITLFVAVLLIVGTARCSRGIGANSSSASGAVLRIGTGMASTQARDRGLRAFVDNITFEGLVKVDQEGRARPMLAQSWRLSADGLKATVQLRPDVTFHDGSSADAGTIVKVLQQDLPKILGRPFEDIDAIAANGDDQVEIRLRRPSPFVIESLDVPIHKPGNPAIGTAPFMAGSNGASEVTAYERYYLGAPFIRRIVISAYPDVRAAWADMLRGRLDMLYEVGIDSLDSLRGATNVSLYGFDRPYQYMVFLNSHSPKLRSPAVRRALNQAVDRIAIVRDGLSGYGTPSRGPVSPHHWAFQEGGDTFTFAPDTAAGTLAHTDELTKRPDRSHLTLRCLTITEPPFERLALLLKQQLARVGVELEVVPDTVDHLMEQLEKPDFEAVLLEAATGWSLFRAYRLWHTAGNYNAAGFSSRPVDAALDEIRHAADDEHYRAGVAAFQQAIADDPPAILLAWSDRSRAVARRFDVHAEPGRDVLNYLRLWAPRRLPSEQSAAPISIAGR